MNTLENTDAVNIVNNIIANAQFIKRMNGIFCICLVLFGFLHLRFHMGYKRKFGSGKHKAGGDCARGYGYGSLLKFKRISV